MKLRALDGFSVPEPTTEEEAALDAWDRRDPIAYRGVLATGDAPPLVLAYFARLAEYCDAWDAGAKDRPVTFDPTAPRLRLFDGPWLGRRSVPEAIDVPRGDMRYAVAVWATYQEAIDAGDIERCRRLAAAIYKRQSMVDAANRVLFDAFDEPGAMA